MVAYFARTTSRSSSTTSSSSSSTTSASSIWAAAAIRTDETPFSRRFKAFKPLSLVEKLRRPFRAVVKTPAPGLRPLSLVDKINTVPVIEHIAAIFPVKEDAVTIVSVEKVNTLPINESIPVVWARERAPYVFIPADPTPYNPLAAIDARQASKPKPVPMPSAPKIIVSSSTSFHSLDSLEDLAAARKDAVPATGAEVVNYPIHVPDFGLNPRVRRMAATRRKVGRKCKCTGKCKAKKTKRTPLQSRFLQALYFSEFVPPPTPYIAQMPFSPMSGRRPNSPVLSGIPSTPSAMLVGLGLDTPAPACRRLGTIQEVLIATAEIAQIKGRGNFHLLT
jgi:hypothetical protein